MAATVPGASGQKQQQQFTFDLDSSHGDPYKKTFVFEFTKTDGWNALPLRDCTLPAGSVLLIERCEVISAVACGRPYMLIHDDGRLVGRPTTSVEGTDLPRPTAFPKWAEWTPLVHGVCGLGEIDRNAIVGPVEALNEERFYMSELWMTLAQLVQSQEDESSHYRLRRWQAQIAAHISPEILRSIRHGSVAQCLKQRYLHCPLIRIRSERPLADLYIHLSSEKKEQEDKEQVVHMAVTVSGKRISHVRPPQNTAAHLSGQLNIDAFFDNLIHPIENGVDFDEFFRRVPIRFHRDRYAMR